LFGLVLYLPFGLLLLAFADQSATCSATIFYLPSFPLTFLLTWTSTGMGLTLMPPTDLLGWHLKFLPSLYACHHFCPILFSSCSCA
jgi:hypothetical protein